MRNEARLFLERIFRRRQSYRTVFLQQDGKPGLAADAVLADLRRFCCAGKPTYRVGPNGVDPIASAIQEGRREVWLRITEHLHLDDRYLTNLREDQANGE